MIVIACGATKSFFYQNGSIIFHSYKSIHTDISCLYVTCIVNFCIVSAVAIGVPCIIHVQA